MSIGLVGEAAGGTEGSADEVFGVPGSLTFIPHPLPLRFIPFDSPEVSRKCHSLTASQPYSKTIQTWYRPHETPTHRAFPIKLAWWNTVFMVGNSAFQVMLCGTMWMLSAYSGDRILLKMATRKSRPPWTTYVASFSALFSRSVLCPLAALPSWALGVKILTLSSNTNFHHPFSGCLIPLSFLCGIGPSPSSPLSTSASMS